MFYVDYISVKRRGGGWGKRLRNFNFIKLMRQPRKKLAAEPKSKAGTGLIHHDDVADF